MAGRSFTRHSNGPTNRIRAEHINELQVASEADDARIDLKADATALTSHTGDTGNPHGVTAAQVGAYTTGQTDSAITSASDALAGSITSHATRTDNPHGVTKAQLGLGNVANVDASPAVLTFVFDGQGEDIEAGEVARVVMPYAATVTGWRVIGSSAGAFTSTVRRATFAAFPTMTTISGSDPPALSGTQKAEDTSLTGWTAALAAGDVVELLITAATVPWVSVQLIMQRS